MKIIPSSKRNRYIAGIGIVLVVVILIVAINTLSNRLDNELEVSPLETAALELDSGASIEIPFGAIFEETTLSITEVEPPEDGGPVPSSVYDFSIGDAELFEPVKLKIPYDAPAHVTYDELSAIRWLEDLEAWEVLGGDVDTVSKTVEVEVEHLSLFSVFWDTKGDSSETSSPQVEPVIGLFEPRYLRTDYALMGEEFEMYYSFTNRGEETFRGTLVLELTFPENSVMQMQRFSYDDFKVTRSGFLEVIYSCHDSDLDSIILKGQEYGNLVIQLDVIFQNDNGEELGRDSKTYSIPIVNKAPLDSLVKVDNRLYRVSSNYDSEGQVDYEVEDFDTGDKVTDTSIHDKAVYTAWIQEGIRLHNASLYILTSRISRINKISAHLGGSVAWVFGKPATLGIAVATKGYWGLGVEIAKEALIGVIKQIGEHPEAYTEQVAIDLIDEWQARISKWTATLTSVALGDELSFHDALEIQNVSYFSLVYYEPAFDSLNAIWNEEFSDWNSDILRAGTVKVAEDVTQLAVAEIKYLADVVSVLLELNDNVMDYPPYALLVNQSNENRQYYYEEYYDNLAMLGIEETSPFSLEVFEASLPAGEENVEPIPYDCSPFTEHPREMAKMQSTIVVDKDTIEIGDTLKILAEWEYLGPLTPIPGNPQIEIVEMMGEERERLWMEWDLWEKEKCIKIGDKYQLEVSWDLIGSSGEYLPAGDYLITAIINSYCDMEDCTWLWLDGAGEIYITIEEPGHGGDDGCFTADTKVLMADGSFKPIIDIKENEEVLSFDFTTNSLSNNKVTGLLKFDADSYLLINNNLRVTGKHPFAVGFDAWKEAAKLKVGDKVLGLKDIKLTSIKKVLKSVQVFNLTVDGTHNYFVSDGKEVFLVHNKAGGD